MRMTRRGFGAAALGIGGTLALGTTARAEDAAAALAAMKGHVFSKGPHGETPAAASEVALSEDELAKIKAMQPTAAICMHYGGNDWSRAQIAGLRKQFSAMGIKVIAVTDAGFKSARQVSDIETVLARHPSIIVSIPVDPVATAPAYQEAAEQGVKLVFMDNVPNGMTAGHGYVSVVSADNYGNGVVSALLLVEALKGKGTVGLVYHAANFFVTHQRYVAVKKTLAGYPGIKVVAEQGIGGPDFSSEADRVTSAMLTSHPTLDGVWAVWDVPAEGVVSAARTAGRNNLVVTNCDLGENVAIAMAQRQFIMGIGSQRPFDQGTTEAKLAGYGLLGKAAPPYVALPALPVTRANLLDAWQKVYHGPAPKLLQEAMKA